MARIIGIARDTGVPGYIGDGNNEWPAVHVMDAAHLFRLALENASAGSVLHAVADEGVPLRDIAEVVGRRLNILLPSVSPDDAPTHFSWLAGFLGMNSPGVEHADTRNASHLFRLALENASAGSVLHAVADEGVPLRDIPEVVGRRLNIPVTSVSPGLIRAGPAAV
jgi:TusA-related sulfurtransferase